MKSTFRKSQILILFFTTIFSLIYIGEALLCYRQDELVKLNMIIEQENMIDNASDTAFLYKVFAGVGILLLLNVWSVMDYWIEARRKEIYVRKLCGANVYQQMLWMLKQFICLIITSFLFAQIIIVLVSESNFFLSSYLKNADYRTIGMCFVFAIICILIGAVKLGIKKGKNWIKIRYGIFAVQMFVTALIILYASSEYITYGKFIQKVEAIEDKVLTISYAQQIDSEEFAKASEQEFEEVREYIEEITGEECFSFEHGTIIMENVKSAEKYKVYSIEDMDFYNALYVTEKVQEIYEWKCKSGDLFLEKDFIMKNDSYIPVLVGCSFEKDYQVGDIIDNTYMIQGILTEDAFFLNPRWEGKVYSLDTTVVIPMEYQLAVWGGAYVNQLNLLDADAKTMELICEKINEMGMPEITFREMEEQLTYIQSDIAFQMKMYGAITGILLVLCTISQIAMLLYLIEIQKREYSIRLMCGATMFDVGVRLVLPVLAILVVDYGIAIVLLDMFAYFWIGIFCAVLLVAVIMIFPLYKLCRKPITELVKENK